MIVVVAEEWVVPVMIPYEPHRATPIVPTIVFTRAETAKALKIGLTHLDQLLKSRELRSVRLGPRLRRIEYAAVQEFLAAHLDSSDGQ